MSIDILESNKMVANLNKGSETNPRITSNRTFTKTILTQGHGFLRPYMESVCVVDISHRINKDSEILGTCENSLQELKVPIGENINLMLGSAETEAVRLLERCIMTMRKGEESEFVIEYVNDIPIDVDMQKQHISGLLCIHLHNFTETKPIWSLTSEEKYELALQHKEHGTDFFKEDKIEAAFCQYSIAVLYLICITECTSVLGEKLQPERKCLREIFMVLKCFCYLNLAACQTKVANHRSVINNCTHALLLDRTNVKGLYRRAQAYLASGRMEEARADLKQALKIEPQNRAISSLMQSCYL